MSVAESYEVRQARVSVYDSREAMGTAAGRFGTQLIREKLADQQSVRIIVACAPSQAATMKTLAAEPDLDWSRIKVFHMDEYLGLPEDHPAGFRRWLREHLTSHVAAQRVHYLNGDAADPQAECERYAALLAEAPIDVCFLGMGENGHIAFNDPPVANFEDPLAVKVVELDEPCRLQQVNEGHFPDFVAVPTHALTLTCPTLLAAQHLVASVPGAAKAQAVHDALLGPRSTQCPASAIADHPSAAVFLDSESAALWRAAC